MSLLSGQVTGLSDWDICIDPGHSQTENMGVNGYSEAEEVLRVGSHLRDILLTQTDIDTVYMTRTNDQQSVSLSQRTTYANSNSASWFHSIHSNAGAIDHNNTLLLWGQLSDGTPDPPVGGEEMSGYMIDILTRTMRIPTIGSWGDCSFYTWSDYCDDSGGPYLYINRNTNMPSELSEEGHHTNPPQNQLHMNEEYKRLLAYSFFWSILRYHEIDRPFVGISAGIISDMESGLAVNGAQITMGVQSYITDTYESLFHIYSSEPGELGNGFYFFEGLEDSTFDVIVTADDYYSDTSSVTILDTFITFHDIELLSSSSPFITGSFPADGDSLFPAWNDLVFDFSRIMNTASVESAFSIVPSTDCTFSWSNNYQTLTVHSDSLAFETLYHIYFSDSAMDVHGHQFDGDNNGSPGGQYSMTFVTGPPDMMPPVILSTYPENVTQNVERHPIINVEFNEAVGPDSVINEIFFLERFVDHSHVPGTNMHYTVNERSVFCFFPDQAIQMNETFVIRIYPGLVDGFNNAMEYSQSFSFQTGSYDYDITLIDPFESNIMTNWWDPQMSGSTSGIIADSTGISVNNEIVNLLTNSNSSMQLDYGWDTTAGTWLLREYLSGGSPREVYFDDSYILQAYIFGDGSGNQFRFAVDDNLPLTGAEYHEVSPWYIIDWIGWRMISWNMTHDGTGTWIGDGDLDGEMRFDSFQMTYSPGNSQYGTLLIDDLRIVQQTALYNDDRLVYPQEFKLFPNYPNPFNPQTRINYQLPKNDHVKLIITDIRGRQIIELKNLRQGAGVHSIIWNGKDRFGQPVSAGVYFALLKAGNKTSTRKMLLVK
tara:strand:- start:1010 stop:3481 length:2472 start_codon:yes stop_codon:yes gene_type:complete